MVIKFGRSSTGVVYELQDKLADDTKYHLIQELERNIFSPTFDDITLKFSNFDLYFSDLFNQLSLNSSEYFMVEIYVDATNNTGNNRCVFRGYVDVESIEFTFNDEYVTFDVFSAIKVFWDRAKEVYLQTKPVGVFDEYLTYMTVSELLWRELIGTGTFYDLFTSISVDSYIAPRNIRAWAESTDPAIGNLGRYSTLSDDVTIFDLLMAMGIYYNAEYYIDSETKKFVMKKRESFGVSTKTVQLDDVLLDESAAKLKLYTAEKVDYLHMIFAVPPPPAPTFINFETVCYVALGDNGSYPCQVGMVHNYEGSFPEYDYSYRITAVLQTTNGLYETFGGEMMTTPIVEVTGLSIGVYAHIQIPPVQFENVVARRIYRNRTSNIGFVEGTRFNLVGEVAGNASVEFIDRSRRPFNYPNLVAMPTDVDVVKGWIRYNEATGAWDTVKFDMTGGARSPRGNIKSIIPSLVFKNTNDPTKVIDVNNGEYPLYLFSFFGREGGDAASLNTFYQQWIDLFRTRRGLTVMVEGLDYKIGDKIVTGKKLVPFGLNEGQEFLIRGADGNLNDEKTVLIAKSI